MVQQACQPVPCAPAAAAKVILYKSYGEPNSQIIHQKKSPTQDFIKRTLMAAAGFIRSIVVIIMMTGGHDPILRLRNY